MSKNRAAKLSSTQESADASMLSDDVVSIDRIEAMFMRLTKVMADSFNASINQLVQTMESNLNLKIESQARELFLLAQKVDSLEKKLDTVQASNSALSTELKTVIDENNSLRSTVENQEQYTRIDNVLVHGVPLPPSGQTENLFEVIPNILNKLLPAVSLTPETISAVHRLPSASHNAASSTPKPPPVVVKFVRRQTKNFVMVNRKFLKGKQTVISEHQSPSRSALLKKASQLAAANKVQSAWSQDGKILLRSLKDRTVQIFSEADLAQFN